MKPDMKHVVLLIEKRKENPDLFDMALEYAMRRGWWNILGIDIEKISKDIEVNNNELIDLQLPIIPTEYQVKIIQTAQYIVTHANIDDVLMVAKCSNMLPKTQDIPYDRLETLCYDMIDVLTINFEYDWELLHKETGITKEEYYKLYNYAEEVNKDVEE